MKWKIPDINGISYTSTMSIYSNGVLIAELLPGKGLVLAKDPETKECWVVAQDPPPGDYTILIESGTESGTSVIVYESGVISGEKTISNETVEHSWKRILPNVDIVDVKTATDRYLICKGCPQFQNDVCLACGCFLPFKTKTKGEFCPQEKW